MELPLLPPPSDSMECTPYLGLSVIWRLYATLGLTLLPPGADADRRGAAVAWRGCAECGLQAAADASHPHDRRQDRVEQ